MCLFRIVAIIIYDYFSDNIIISSVDKWTKRWNDLSLFIGIILTRLIYAKKKSYITYNTKDESVTFILRIYWTKNDKQSESSCESC